MARKKTTPSAPAQPELFPPPAGAPETPTAPEGLDAALRAIAALAGLPEEARVAAYNAITRAAAALVADVSTDPVLAIQLLRSDRVADNDYNPNHTADPEMQLLETSIREDGVTMPVVTACVPEDERASPDVDHVVADGFHRKSVLVLRLHRKYLPCSVIAATARDARMAATVRHNRARGKHGVIPMGKLVRALMDAGWSDARIAEHLGMSLEELLRLKQTVGAAALLAAKEYGPAWTGLDGPGGLDGKGVVSDVPAPAEALHDPADAPDEP